MHAADVAPILVTGAAGFLGSHVTAALVAQGHRVLAFDIDHAQGRLPDAHPLIERISGDLRDDALVQQLVARASRVMHFGAIAGVHHYIERTLDVLDVNLLGTRSVLMACHAHGKPVLIASTSEVYGKNPAMLSEAADTWLGPPTHARWCYATSKVAGEHYAWALARQGLAVAAVRYFNVYGPTLDAPGEGRVLAQFLGRIQAGEPLVLVDGGKAVRCLCYIDDAVRATVDLLLRLEPGSALIGRPYNVGNPEPVTMAELAQRTLRLSGHPHGVIDVPGEVFFGPGFEDIGHRVPDVSALREAIGFEATVPLDVGLASTLDHWGMLAEHPTDPPRPTIPVIKPVYDADAGLMARMRRALNMGHTTNGGPQVTALEAEMADYLDVDHVLTVGSGAEGLHAALRALDRTGVAILPSFTYIATLNAVELAGLTPVFCDVDPGTWTLDADHLARLLHAHPDVAVVVPVCTYGVPPDLDAICALAKRAGAAVVYDAAHAMGSTLHGSRCPDGPDITVFSLHATKVLPATEGGLVVATDPDLHARLAQIRTHGLADDPLHSIPGLNAKMDEMAAATARHSLANIDGTLERRRRYLARLTRALLAAGFTVQAVPDGVTPNGQNLCAIPPVPRERAEAVFESHGIGTRRYFHPALHHLHRLAPATSLPVTERLAHDLLCLPLHARMDEATLLRLEAAIADVGR